MRASEEIKRFLDFLRQCETRYDIAVAEVEKENRCLQDYLHAIEFEPHAEERSKTATRLRASRRARRRAKDEAEELEFITAYVRDPKYKGAIDQLAQILGRVRKVERYHENRTYRPREGTR